jgi:predicted chitinase
MNFIIRKSKRKALETVTRKINGERSGEGRRGQRLR